MSKLVLYNTLSKKKETFNSLVPNKVSFYLCGVTVYDNCHIGHARAYIVFDTIRRHLMYLGYDVSFIQNFTDIDDKIIKRSSEKGVSWKALVKTNISSFFEDMDALNILRASVYPKATDHIREMISIIKDLMEKGIAYQAGDDVCFSVDAFEGYGKLSKKKLEDLVAGSRVEVSTEKKNPFDFVLWKPAKEGEPFWGSPWGKGRPGWHIECSAMVKKLLGHTIDIHAGGEDLVFPHHENEIAQSEGANNCTFVNTWMHVGFVNINDEKMSKSLNNFFTIRGVLESFDGETLRYFIMSSHYRSPLNFSDANLNNAKSSLTRLYTAIRGLHASDAALNEVSQRFDFETRFNEALDDDFNTPIALSILFELAKLINSERSKDIDQANALAQLLVKLGGYIGILQMQADTFLKQGVALSDEDIDKKIKQRDEAKANKDFATSDQIRDELTELGIVLEDSANGTSWRRG